MPTGTVSIDIQATPESIFDLIHNYRKRLEWDSFLREACLLDSAEEAAVGVSTRCVARRVAGGMAMDTVYVSFNRPTVAAVAMTQGPIFLRRFAASIRQQPLDETTTRVTYRYHFVIRPGWMTFLSGPLVAWVFHKETHQRLVALKKHFELC